MDFEEFVRKTDELRNLSRGTTDDEIKKELKTQFFDVLIDYFNGNFTGDFHHVDGSVTFVGAIEPEPRTKNTPYNETPTKGTIMSSQTSATPENSTAPQTSKIAEKLNSLKPSNLPDEKKETVLRRIKLTAAFAAGVLTTVTAVAVKSYYNSIDATDEVQESDESSETETTD